MKESLPTREIPTAETILGELKMLREGAIDPLAMAKAQLLIVSGGSVCPEKTYEFLLESKSEAFMSLGMPTLFSVWVATNESGAIKFVRQMENMKERETVELRLLLALAQNNPQHALEVIRNNPEIDFSKGSNVSNVFFEAFCALGAKGLTEALGQIDELANPLKENLALQGVAAAAVKEDLGAAIDWCGDSLMDGGVKKQILAFMMRRAILEDPSHALEELTSRVKSGAIDPALAAASISYNRKELVNCNFDSACGMVLTLCERDSQYSHLLLSLLEDYGKSAPGDASKRMEELLQRESERFERLGGPFLDAYQSLNARILLEEHPEQYNYALERINIGNHEVLSGLFSNLFQHHGEDFADYLMGCSGERLSSDVRREYLEDWIRKDPERAYRWVTSQLPIGEDRDRLQFVYDFGRMDQNMPEYMTRLANAEDSASNRKLVRILAGQLGRSKVQAAATWALSLENADLKIEAVDAVSAEWISRDSVAASAWISTMPAGEERTRAVGNLVKAIRPVDPVSAAAWEKELVK